MPQPLDLNKSHVSIILWDHFAQPGQALGNAALIESAVAERETLRAPLRPRVRLEPA